jgi:hypothetical protein
MEAKMSDMSQLLVGITSLIVSIGVLFACLPRHGKTAWVVQKPFAAPALAILMICGLAIGLVEIASYFTTIDELTLSGKPL